MADFPYVRPRKRSVARFTDVPDAVVARSVGCGQRMNIHASIHLEFARERQLER